ncbi:MULTISPECIES: family 3 encapsulin nanocompartment shell protein [Thermomonosporaceae]|uniref:family 3 encapsulin nanocompartment shell protein n=1 Tax=Thermomonosporaceae TaxID=2012 RepID=UPI00255AB7CB|nr:MULTISPECIES: family 3 encapsulin nanocompartment shell protein [Thermomonosporaceae]MDL4771040.1 family 3 encapsulin nanocompartment shell protein [Actinomadura xylanilytica]
MLDYLIDDPALRARSLGEELAVAVARANGGDAAIRVRTPLTTLFPLASTRPRPTVREQTKGGTVADEALRYVREGRDEAGGAESGTRYRTTPEAAFRPTVAKAELTEISVRVPVPAEVCSDPALLARFVEHRVVVRLCTVENEVLLHGSDDGAIPGLLRLDGLRHVSAPGQGDGDARAGTVLDALMTGCAEVEETGGSCDGLVMHPALYWRLVGAGALPSLDAAGLRITRTRMIERDRVLLGDFRAGITLLDGEVSTVTLRRSGEEATITASMRLGLAVHLPQHFVLLGL